MASLIPDARRVAQDLDALAAIGRVGETGVRRLAFTAEDLEARAYVMQRIREAGLKIRLDAVGNIFGRRAGKSSEQAVVMFGSHIDTTALAGRFDGTVGVVGALEVIRLFNDHDLSTAWPLEVVVFAAEESARFEMALLGSKAASGRLSAENLRWLRDESGISLWEALEHAGLHPEELPSCEIPSGYARAYLELHIEQGPVLASSNRRIGLVTSIAALTRGIVSVRGQASHAGATPMEMRRDALAAAAELVLGLERVAREKTGHGMVGTVGMLRVHPGAINTIPGEVQFSVDIRSADTVSTRRAVDAVRALMDRVGRERRVAVNLEITAEEPSTSPAAAIVETLAGVCRDLGIEPHFMASGSIHDAQETSRYTEMGMIFVPSERGISHAPEEYTSLADVCLGVQVLAEGVRRLAGSPD